MLLEAHRTEQVALAHVRSDLGVGGRRLELLLARLGGHDLLHVGLLRGLGHRYREHLLLVPHALELDLPCLRLDGLPLLAQLPDSLLLLLPFLLALSSGESRLQYETWLRELLLCGGRREAAPFPGRRRMRSSLLLVRFLSRWADDSLLVALEQLLHDLELVRSVLRLRDGAQRVVCRLGERADLYLAVVLGSDVGLNDGTDSLEDLAVQDESVRTWPLEVELCLSYIFLGLLL